MRVESAWGQTVERYQRLERALGRLENDLASAQPFFGVPFQGSAQDFALELARVEALAGTEDRPSTDWVKIVYRFEPNEGGLLLVRETFLWSADSEAREPLHREVLAQVAEGQFWFRVKDRPTGELQWVKQWDGKTNGVPRLIMFDWTLPSAGGQSPFSFSRVFRNPSGRLPEVGLP